MIANHQPKVWDREIICDPMIFLLQSIDYQRALSYLEILLGYPKQKVWDHIYKLALEFHPHWFSDTRTTTQVTKLAKTISKF